MKYIYLSFVLLISSLPAFSQFTNIEIDNSTGSDYLSEPFINFNPDNPNEIVVGTNLSYAFYSHDGGFNWTKVELTSDYGVYGDPCVVCDTNGDFYFFHLSDPGESGGDDWVDRVVCQKSTDAGVSWNDISYTGLNGIKKNDKEYAVIDRSTNNIYLTWTQADAYHSSAPEDSSIILFSASEDAGVTWNQPLRLSKKAGDSNGGINMLRSAVPCIGPDGQIYVAWAGSNSIGELGIVFDKSIDNGYTWLQEDKFVSFIPGGCQFHIPGIWQQDDGTDPGTGWPNTACDTSGGIYNGNIYICWADQRNDPNDADIWFVRSEDEGETWSSPFRVNNDPSGNHQFFPFMTIDQTNGYIYIVFYDRRNHTDNATDVFLAVSEDGGETFINRKISSTPFTPTEDVFFGDYTNIIAYNNMIRPVWTRLNGGTISIQTAIIEAPLLVENIDHILLETESYPNPFKDEIHFSFKLREKSEVSLSFCDVFGREIKILRQNESLKPGKHVETLNAEHLNLISGMYFFKLTSDNKVTIREVVYTK